MFKKVSLFMQTTWIFMFVRLVASAVLGLLYILVAAAIQYMYVSILGETTFNYIIGGILSMALGALAMHYVGVLIFMFVRGWHVSAIAYASQIKKRNLPALEVGMTVFRKHFTSFALVYGISLLVHKFAKKGVGALWDMLDDVPYLGSLEKIAKTPIVVKLGMDILDTAFDGIIFYIVRYTKPGISDDAKAVPEALKRYVYSLPQVLLASLGTFVLFYVIPRVLHMSVFMSVLFSNGIVAGILINVLLYPLFYVLNRTFFEPIETMILLSCYAKRCTEEVIDENSKFKSFIDEVLSAAGFSDFVSSDEDSTRKTPTAKKESGKEPAQEAGELPEDDETIEVEPVFEDDVIEPKQGHREDDVAKLPLAVDDDDAELKQASHSVNPSWIPGGESLESTKSRTPPYMNLSEWIASSQVIQDDSRDPADNIRIADDEPIGPLDSRSDMRPPVTSLADMINNFGADKFAEAFDHSDLFGSTDDVDSDSDSESRVDSYLGGGDIEM